MQPFTSRNLLMVQWDRLPIWVKCMVVLQMATHLLRQILQMHVCCWREAIPVCFLAYAMGWVHESVRIHISFNWFIYSTNISNEEFTISTFWPGRDSEIKALLEWLGNGQRDRTTINLQRQKIEYSPNRPGNTCVSGIHTFKWSINRRDSNVTRDTVTAFVQLLCS